MTKTTKAQYLQADDLTGETISNGARIMMAYLRPDGEWIALCEYNGEYVTWRLDFESGGDIFAESGNYFAVDRLPEAVANWLDRSMTKTDSMSAKVCQRLQSIVNRLKS